MGSMGNAETTGKPGHLVLTHSERARRCNGQFTHEWAIIMCGYPGCRRREGCAALSVDDARRGFRVTGWSMHADYGHICPRHEPSA